MSLTEYDYALFAKDSYMRPATSAEDVPYPAGAALITSVASDGFAATAYVAGDTVVIAYRGTDNLLIDPLTGYPTAWGGYASPQLQAAFEFYYAIEAMAEYETMDIVLTGHSLGGGLAGAVGAVKGLGAHLFDHMPFEASVEAIYAAGTAEFPNAIEAAWAQFIYGEAPATPPSYADVTATHVDADLLAFSRDLLDSMNGNALSSYGAALNENPILNAIAAHSITLLAILQWADENAVETYWTAVASTVLPLVLSADVAEAAGFAAGAALPSFGTDIAEYMSTTLAYSDSLGGVALLRLFDDLNDLARRSASAAPRRLPSLPCLTPPAWPWPVSRRASTKVSFCMTKTQGCLTSICRPRRGLLARRGAMPLNASCSITCWSRRWGGVTGDTYPVNLPS